jgi:hypothetical protein
LWPFGFPEGFLLLYLEFRIKIFDKKMEVGNLIGDIINIPTQFQELGNVTFPHLLRNYGYFALFSHITEDKILEELNRHPEWVQQWLNYSADQRCSPAWYFIEGENGKYIVDRYPPIKNSPAREFENVNEACAVFIKIYIEKIRTM